MAAAVVAALTAEEFMSLGLEVNNHHPKWRQYKHQCNVDRFKEDYGVIPETCVVLWNDMRNSIAPTVRLVRGDKPVLFLLALRFLWTYQTETDLCTFFNIRGKQTVRKWWKHYVRKIEKLLDGKVSSVRCNGLYYAIDLPG